MLLDDGIIMNTKLRFILERIKCKFFIYFKKIVFNSIDRFAKSCSPSPSSIANPPFSCNSFFLLSELIHWNRMQDFLHPFHLIIYTSISL
jgi:hypothetical protein